MQGMLVNGHCRRFLRNRWYEVAFTIGVGMALSQFGIDFHSPVDPQRGNHSSDFGEIADNPGRRAASTIDFHNPG